MGFFNPIVGSDLAKKKEGIHFGPRRSLKTGVAVTWLPGGKPQLLFGSVEVCKQFYIDHLITRPPVLGLGAFADQLLGQCLGVLDSARWGRVKAAFRHLFAVNESDIFPLLKDMLDEWEGYLKGIYLEQKVVDVIEVTQDIPYKFMLKVLFGTRFAKEKQIVFNLLRHQSAKLMSFAFNNNWARYKWIAEYGYPTQKALLASFLLLWDQTLKAYLGSDKSGDLLEKGLLTLIQWNPKSDVLVSFENISHTISEILFANMEVTVPVAATLLCHYTLFPDSIGQGSTHELRAFIEESARHLPIIFLSLQQESSKDKTINLLNFPNGPSFQIPKGTNLCIDFVSLGRNQQDWAEFHGEDEKNQSKKEENNLSSFNPKRYSEILSDERKKKWAIQRFGLGARTCPGQKFANIILLGMLQVIKKYKFTPDVGFLSFTPFIRLDPAKTFNCPHASIRLDRIMDFKEPLSITLMKKFSLRPFGYDGPDEEIQDSNLFLGVSVNGNSPYLKREHVEKVIDLLCQQKNETCIVFSGKIAHFNYIAFNNKTEPKALKIANKVEKKLMDIFKSVINSKSAQERKKFTLLPWPHDKKVHEFMHQQYEEHDTFKAQVDKVTKKFIMHWKKISEEKWDEKIFTEDTCMVRNCREYILAEIPVLLRGIMLNGKHFDLMAYAGYEKHLMLMFNTETSLSRLILDIHKKDEFLIMREGLKKFHNHFAKMGFMLIPLPDGINKEV